MKVNILVFAILFIGIISCNKNTERKNLQAKKIQKPFEKLQTSWDEDLSPKIDKWFKEFYSSTRFNGNLLLAKNGKVIYQNTYGYSNYRNKDTLSLEHSFQTGSVSKPFTSMAIMILKEKGLLRYTDSVQVFFPDFPYKGITVWHLLSHRSGLSNYNYFCDKLTNRETIIKNRDVIKIMADTAPAPYFRPDERFDYCNTNYVILASIVEKVSGKTFSDFMKEEVFKKAGMNSTWIFENGKPNRKIKKATGYHYPWEVALPTYQDGVVGDKGVYTTLADLWRWNQALENETFVKKETLEEAFKPTSFEKEGNNNYGFGWRLRTNIDSSKYVFHGGWWRGFNTLFLKDLKNDVVLVILGNVRTKAIYAKYQELLGIVDPDRWNMQLDADSLYINLAKVEIKKNIDTVKIKKESDRRTLSE